MIPRAKSILIEMLKALGWLLLATFPTALAILQGYLAGVHYLSCYSNARNVDVFAQAGIVGCVMFALYNSISLAFFIALASDKVQSIGWLRLLMIYLGTMLIIFMVAFNMINANMSICQGLIR